MKKSDLKTGMWVKTVDRLWMIVIVEDKPCMITPTGWLPIDSFPKTRKDSSHWDILAVYDYSVEIEEHHYRASSLQYDVLKDEVEKKNSAYFIKIWDAYKDRETVKIGEIAYDKAEFEEAVKNLKPIN